jgi:hypothetical protein
MDQRINDVISIGITSRVAAFACKYPWLVTLLLVILTDILVCIFDYNIHRLLRGTFVLIFSFGILTVLIQVSTTAWCYKIEIDLNDKLISFYKLFNRGVYQFRIENTSIIIDSYCNIFVGKSKFVIHADFIHDLVAYLPKDTVIEYRGRIGTYKEKHWQKGPLIPGSKYQ